MMHKTAVNMLLLTGAETFSAFHFQHSLEIKINEWIMDSSARAGNVVAVFWVQQHQFP